jgi:hypothetical protein
MGTSREMKIEAEIHGGPDRARHQGVLVLPDGTEVSVYGDGSIFTPESLAILQEVVQATGGIARQWLVEQLRLCAEIARLSV